MLQSAIKIISSIAQYIPWKQIQVKVFKLQRRIYRASLNGDIRQVHRLQRLVHLNQATCLHCEQAA
ncbi:reverse transcriptase N-terminal domain-containing protein [filamentous cyanobacterium LEGE 11480]|uniref:Reverse transcriptase N-terminal domain-containing protein n=1 Tax=Romeriopsis navalis LEGE 11480 TaxID=2777977 RepID=A0A928Z4K3_9CYAN|nr:reverse transcriptase N-terminal domain-containing protein [Romeriopsis navalis LEGE 11480]